MNKENDKAKFVLISSVKMEYQLKSCIGNRTFKLRNGIASTNAKRQSTRALQHRIQSKRDINMLIAYQYSNSESTFHLLGCKKQNTPTKKIIENVTCFPYQQKYISRHFK